MTVSNKPLVGLSIQVILLTLFSHLPANLVAQDENMHPVGQQQLPTGRAITPAGETVAFYGRPVDLEISRDQKWLFVKDRHHLRVIDAGTFKLIDSIGSAGGASLFGLATDRSGSVYFSNAKNQVHVFHFNAENRKLELLNSIELAKGSFPCGICLSADEQQLFVCLSRKNAVALVDIENKKVTGQIDVGVAPFDVLQIGQQLVVSNIGGRRPIKGDKTATSAGTDTAVDDRGIANTGTLSIVSLDQQQVTSEIAVGLHPSVLTADEGNAIVCNTNQDSLSVVNLSEETMSIDIKPDDRLSFGSMPSCLRWMPDRKHLLVALAGNNAITVLKRNNTGKFASIGLIPTAWYPAAIACSDEHVFVANIKGFGSRERRRDESKGRSSHDHQGVVQRIAIADILDEAKLKTWTNQVSGNSKFAQIARSQILSETREGTEPVPFPKELGQPSLIKHVIYVIKENRTFDQVFGDYREARSEVKLCLFPREVTPNHHALADRFGILDNYYCNGVLSADGHSWATEGNVTPYLERAFGGFSRSYTFGDDPITYSSSGFIWDHVLASGLSFRNYGEMDYAKPPGNIRYQEILRKYEAGEAIEFEQNIGIERLQKYSCRDYPGWNMNIPDVLRMGRFLKEFREFEKDGTLPNLCIVYLPQDHLGGAGVTSKAHMADNDLALGRLVAAVSHSRFWKETVIFVNEDDPQNGFDHIDGHRSICLVISPYSNKGVNHHFYNQTSVLRSMLHIFGLPPMNQQDASAPLMRACFQSKSDLTAYDAITPETKLNELPKKQSRWSPDEKHWRSVLATVPIERTGMKTDQDEDNLNRFIWHDVKGWQTPYPVEFAGAHGRGLQDLNLKIISDGAED